MGLGPHPYHHHPLIVTTTTATTLLYPPEPPLVVYCPSFESVPRLVAGLRLYCVRPPMGYLDLGPSVSGPDCRPLAIHVTRVYTYKSYYYCQAPDRQFQPR